MERIKPCRAFLSAVALMLVGVWLLAAPRSHARAPGVLTEAQMGATWGAQSYPCGDCDHVDNSANCATSDACTKCQNIEGIVPSCGGPVDVGTGNIQKMCGTWEAPTLLCAQDGTVYCKMGYICNTSPASQNSTCSGVSGNCIQGTTNCAECSRGASLQAKYLTNYKCSSV